MSIELVNEEASKDQISLTPASLKSLIEGVVSTAIQEARKPQTLELSKEEQAKLEETLKTEWQRQREEPHRWIEFQMTEDDKDTMVYVGVNGVSYWYRKNMRIPVPQCVIHSLGNAKVNSWRSELDEQSGQMRKRQFSFMRFPYQDHGAASAREVADWKARNSTQLS